MTIAGRGRATGCTWADGGEGGDRSIYPIRQYECIPNMINPHTERTGNYRALIGKLSLRELVGGREGAKYVRTALRIVPSPLPRSLISDDDEEQHSALLAVPRYGLK